MGLVVNRGAGEHFCAGHDLSEKPHADALGWLRREMQTLELLTRLRQPVIAAVRGTCFTGGLELALSAAFILCGESARFADTHGKRSEEHTSELQSLMRISYAVFCLKKKTTECE